MPLQSPISSSVLTLLTRLHLLTSTNHTVPQYIATIVTAPQLAHINVNNRVPRLTLSSFALPRSRSRDAIPTANTVSKSAATKAKRKDMYDATMFVIMRSRDSRKSNVGIASTAIRPELVKETIRKATIALRIVSKIPRKASPESANLAMSGIDIWFWPIMSVEILLETIRCNAA
jgi:hypothetical protein